MIYTYKECLEKWSSDYRIKKADCSGESVSDREGDILRYGGCIYSCRYFQKYPKAILLWTVHSIIMGLLMSFRMNIISQRIKHAIYINDKRIHQYYVPVRYFEHRCYNYETKRCNYQNL